jgi:hypothetical protein
MNIIHVCEDMKAAKLRFSYDNVEQGVKFKSPSRLRIVRNDGSQHFYTSQYNDPNKCRGAKALIEIHVPNGLRANAYEWVSLQHENLMKYDDA